MAETEPMINITESTQKKRGGKRTARACDECRMRKSKCDGLQPCEACQITYRHCTYNLSAGRSTGSGTRIRILEDRLRRARAYLNEAQRRTPSLANIDFDSLLGPSDEYDKPQARQTGSEEDDGQEKLESMMDSYGQMTINTGNDMQRDFYGAASGLAWIQKTGTYFEDAGSDGSYDPAANSYAAVQLFDAPLPPKSVLPVDSPPPELIPPRTTAMKLLRVVFQQVYPMFHFLCEEKFQESMGRLYDRDAKDYEEKDQEFLPLFYLVLSLGYLFSKEQHDRQGCRTSVGQAMRLFIAGRSMIDIAYLRTLNSLQSLICLVLFLISTARMASAHGFLGAACASALRQGMHFRSTHEASIDDVEKKVRRRVFWAVMNLDMYVSGVLGLPTFMDLSAVDPAIDLTIEAALGEAQDMSSADGLALSASAKHVELMRIIFKAQRTLYPKPTDPPGSKQRNGTISVSVSALQKVEVQFREWAQSLTGILSHPDDNIETQSIKYEMHMCYYFAQIVLYRAFLHYLVKQNDDDSIGQRQLSYAHTAVRMASKVIEVSVEHQRKGLLCPASWPSVYTVFISTVCLTFAYATRKEGTVASEFKEQIENGIRLLACTACTTDTGSVRCLEILRRLIKRVSYTVDIDLDGLSTQTKPCCTTKFSPNMAPMAFDIESLQMPWQDDSESLSTVSHSQTPSHIQAPTPAAGMHQYRMSPDMTMTQPSFASIGDRTQTAIPPDLTYLGRDEEMMEIPYGGTFSWPEHEFHDAASRLGQPEEAETELPMGSRVPRATSMNPRLSAQDIAAFMHIDPTDEIYRRGDQNR